MKSDIETAKWVLEQEIKGLQALESAVDDKFTQAVDILHNITGRVIISGMGKSGHIARKMSATFASTGTAAFFVHPAEASHGDLGMITKNDAVILLSNSGETTELQDIINYCVRYSIPIIAIVRRETSVLVESATIAFILPEIAEASPVDAPTTSTTMMLAWGDALAVALLKRKGFQKEDFGIFHPGGKLGSQFIKISKIMKNGTDLPTVNPDDSMSEAIIIITQKSLGCAAVIDTNGAAIGIITDGDLRRNMGCDLMNKKVAEVMTPAPISVNPSMLVSEALGIMNERSVTSLFVSEDEKLTGIIHIHDVLRAGVS